ncbi:MAG: UDP-N-acetylmuramoyl-tripeptide--D-alanyl-D-alanine ligase [Spirochaetes bacterium]|nr:UDP-N-acetylmuramoyl-tripeptide--D-alanyl-D-alanine ligase [Spirochaetota bacterium]
MKVEYKNSITNIASIVNGDVAGDPSVTVDSVCTDSRESDSRSLFVPIAGEKFDGHDYIESLVEEKRIAAYITGRQTVASPDIPAVYCENTLYALGNIARAYRENFTFPFIGITGTNGKTTTKELIATALDGSFTVHKNIKNYNNEIGVPFTLLELTDSFDMAVIEMGMNHIGEIARLSAMVKPDVALITNIGAGHLEFLGTTQNVARAKAEIFEPMKAGSVVFINRDTEHYDILEEVAQDKKLVIRSYGLNAEADIRPESYKLRPEHVDIVYRGETVTLPLYGIHNVMNGMAAIAVAEEFGVSVRQCADRLSSFKNASMRGQITEGRCRVINDAYNSNPLSLENALRSVGTIYDSQRIIAVLGDMKELGENEVKLHCESGEVVCHYGFDALYTYGELAAGFAKGAVSAGMDKGKVFSFTDKKQLIEVLLRDIEHEDVVLVKGSRSMKMEEVAEALLR